MRVQLVGGEQEQLAKVPTRNPDAYDAYLRGEAAWNGGVDSDPALLRAAIGFFELAVARDSGMVDAWGELARATSRMYFYGIPSTRVQQSALAAARRAVALDADGAVGHNAMATYYRYVARDDAAALRESELALRAAPGSAGVLVDVANAKSNLGRFDESLRDQEAAIQLDPRNVRLWRGQAQTFLRLHRNSEARAAAMRAVALAPTSTGALMDLIYAEVANGNLPGARQAVAEALRNIPTSRVLADVAVFDDMGWILDAASEQQLLALGPEAFDNDHAQWAIIRAEQYAWRGDSTLARAWGDTARRETAAELKGAPQDPQNHVFLGLSLAYAGRGREAMDEMERGLALAQKDPTGTWSQQNAYLAYAAARVALLAGDHARALDLLGETMRRRHFVTPAWLRLEPTWKSLRGDPQFERLTAAP
jgi:tetratricopeptide (TPR) repeat protein